MTLVLGRWVGRMLTVVRHQRRKASMERPIGLIEQIACRVKRKHLENQRAAQCLFKPAFEVANKVPESDLIYVRIFLFNSCHISLNLSRQTEARKYVKFQRLYIYTSFIISN